MCTHVVGPVLHTANTNIIRWSNYAPIRMLTVKNKQKAHNMVLFSLERAVKTHVCSHKDLTLVTGHRLSAIR